MRRLLVLVPLLLASGCKVGPNYARPDVPPPAVGAFQTTVAGTDAARPTSLSHNVDIVTGARKFVSDLVRPGMLHGVLLRPPTVGSVLVNADTTAAERIPGVRVVRDGDAHLVRGSGAARVHLAAEPPEQLVHDRDVRDRRQVAERGTSGSQQRGSHQLEDAVLGAHDLDRSRQARTPGHSQYLHRTRLARARCCSG